MRIAEISVKNVSRIAELDFATHQRLERFWKLPLELPERSFLTEEWLKPSKIPRSGAPYVPYSICPQTSSSDSSGRVVPGSGYPFCPNRAPGWSGRGFDMAIGYERHKIPPTFGGLSQGGFIPRIVPPISTGYPEYLVK